MICNNDSPLTHSWLFVRSLARKQETCFNSAAYLRTRSVLRPQDHADSPHHSQPGLDSLIAHRLPETLCETVLPVPSGFDKVFASQWIDDHHILIGTKCNRLLLLSTLTTRIVEIPYLSVTTGAAAASSAAHSSNVTAVRSPLYRGDSTRPPHLARQDSGIGSMSSTETSTNAGSARPARPSARTPDSPLACVGIHSIAVNPSKTRMAVGSGKPYEVVVYSLPEMVPVCLMTGHSDLVFSLTFVSDDVLVTASRDTTVGIFSLRSDPSEYLETECGVLPVIRPMGVRQEHTSKVRDIKYNPAAKQLTTLGLDSTVRLWDVNRMHVTSKTNLHFPQETVCLGLDPDRSLISIGSQAHVSLLDTRTLGNRNERITSASRILHSFKSPDEGWGVRSLAHIEHLVTCGGGMGRIGFYDLRALHFLPVGEGRVGYLEARMHDGAGIGSGFGDGNTSGRARTAGAAVRSAIYTLAYSEDKTRLFAGGGPLQLGMRGTYCAVW
ncbi:WD40-repeat-containing domain protein [Catenaria anguillulae PL171]|uniref:WD40-repeat-containing domain protein n=1 Tax=Catenaria anguillulae PL171 TaxID=765915 RepID=A0A1Y2HLE3_9FUNG|nr:WD40-repeat-containing domain protein [Catenaria anguillulae PL171]